MLNKQIIKSALLNCKESYNDKQSSGNNLEYVDRVINGHDQALISYDKKTNHMHISFRGSDDFKDWRSNFRVICKDTEFGRMHRGFYNSTKKLINAIELVLTVSKINYSGIVLSGHSRGGAMSMLANLMLSKKVTHVITFGAPRVFKRSALATINQKLITKNILRYENKMDFVTSIPFALLGFMHIGKKVSSKGMGHDLQEYLKGIE